MEQRDLSRKGEIMLARCGVKRGWRRPEEDHASQGIRRPRWLARAGRIGKLLEKQGQLRPGTFSSAPKPAKSFMLAPGSNPSAKPISSASSRKNLG
jgi:hypothetical protein